MVLGVRAAVAAVAVLLAASSCFAAIAPMIPSGIWEIRNYDFRYPDYVVEPEVPCTSEGFFQHPRDCSWYYRCYSSNYTGTAAFFRRSFFQCEFETTFSGSSCGHSSAATNCAKTCDLTLHNCATMNCSGSIANVCQISVYDCFMNPKPRCGEGEFYDETNAQCVQSDQCSPAPNQVVVITYAPNSQSTTLPSGANSQSTTLPSGANSQSTTLPSGASSQSTTLPSGANSQSTTLPSGANSQSTTGPSGETNDSPTTIIPGENNEPTTSPPEEVTEQATNAPDLAASSPINRELMSRQEFSNCIQEEVCPPGSSKFKETTCESKQVFYLNGVKIGEEDSCGESLFYSIDAHQCVPRDHSCSAPEPMDCRVTSYSCTETYECKSKAKVSLCSASATCEKSVSRRSTCSHPDQFYSRSLDRCVESSPFYRETRLSRNSRPGCVKIHHRNSTIELNYLRNYVCSRKGAVPYPYGISHLRCAEIRVCNSDDKIVEKFQGCEKYYKCDDVNILSFHTCGGSSYFDYVRKLCVDPRYTGRGHYECI